MDYAGNAGHDAPPSGWLYCDGQVVPKATYPRLFAAIGTVFNSGGEEATDFRLPNLQGRVTAGMQSTDDPLLIDTANPGGFGAIALGATGGTPQVALTGDQISAGNVSVPIFTGAGTAGATAVQGVSEGADGNILGSIGNDQPHTNIQPSMLMNKIIYTGG